MNIELQRKQIADQVVSLYDATRESIADLKTRDRMQQAANGKTAINTTGFGIQEIQADAERLAYDARESIENLIGNAIEAASDALVEAPSDEAARYVVSIENRDNLTSAEVERALAKYTDNASQKAILAAASRSGVHVSASGKTDVERFIDDLHELQRKVERAFSPLTFFSDTDGRAAFTRADLALIAQPGQLDAVDQLRAMLV